MESYLPLATPFDLASDIESLASFIANDVMGDLTIQPQALGIAQFLLLTKRMNMAECRRLMNKPGSRQLVSHLITSQSNFISTTPRSLGIDIVTALTADNIQEILNVKHHKEHKEEKDVCQRAVIPNIKLDFLHSDPNFVWVRFHQQGNEERKDKVQVAHSVYEIYISKKYKTKRQVYEETKTLLKELDSDPSLSLIFCSELKWFMYDSFIFLSNYIKFMYCYMTNSPTFDPITYEEVKTFSMYLTFGFLFLETHNLTSMPTSTHGHLVGYTGERPKTMLEKMVKDGTDWVRPIDGCRALQSIDLGSDLGTLSNYIEIVYEVQSKSNTDTLLKCIV
jgi:hypothetical protein